MVKFTKEIANEGRSSNGGWSLAQLRCLGLESFRRGWLSRVLGRSFPEECIAEFIALKDKHNEKKEKG